MIGASPTRRSTTAAAASSGGAAQVHARLTQNLHCKAIGCRPLIGNVEVIYDEQKKRVIYQPVSIEPRVGVPKVIRDDSRWQQAQSEQTQVKS